MRKPVLSLCPSLCPRADLKALSGGQDQLHRLTSLLAHRGGLHQGKAHWLDLPLQPLPPCIKRRAAYSVLLTERLYRLPTLLLTGNQLAPVLPSLRHPLLVAHATTMRPSTPCGLVVFIGCLQILHISQCINSPIMPSHGCSTARALFEHASFRTAGPANFARSVEQPPTS